MKHPEDAEQEALFQWAAFIPELKWMYAVPNGGKRNVREAARLKRQGVKSGISDICLPLPRNGKSALYIELKVGKNKPTVKQKEFIDHMNEVGNLAVVCYSVNEAIDTIKEYMGWCKK